jgi:CheY-like chemotaxis protein
MLLVDNEAGTFETFRDVLTDLGYKVDVAADDLKAVEKARSQTFNAILRDIKMPKLNGVEAYKAITRHQPETAVIMMTGYSRQTRPGEPSYWKVRSHPTLQVIRMEKAITLIAEARRDDNFKGGESPC